MLGDTKTVYLAGYYGFGNAGDEAILATIVAQFRASRPELRFIVASGNPEHTAAVHAVQAVAWNDIAAIHQAQQVADLVVIGGGGLFHDYWGVDPDTFLTNKHWGVSYYAGSALLAALYRKPLMLYGVGVGPLYSEHSIKLTRLAAEAAQAVTVRDPGSKALLEGMGVPQRRVRITADPAFSFQASSEFTLQESLDPSFALRSPVLGVALRDWSVGLHPRFFESEVAQALDLFLEKTGGSVILIPFQDLDEPGVSDRRTAQRVLEQMRLRERAAVTSGPSAPDRVRCCVQACDLILGMRLHSLIFAALAARPAVALCYDPKIDELVKLLGLGDFALSVTDISAERLVAKLILAAQGGQAAGVAQAVAELRRAEPENATIALSLLDAPAVEPRLSPETLNDYFVRTLYNAALDAKQSKAMVTSLSSDTVRLAAEREQLLANRTAAEERLGQLAERFRAVEEENRFLQGQSAEITTSFRQQLTQTTEQCRTVEQESRILHQRVTEITASSAQQLALVTERHRTAEQESRILHQRVTEITASSAQQLALVTERYRTAEQENRVLHQRVAELTASSTQQLAQASEHSRAIEQENQTLYRRITAFADQYLEVSQKYAGESIRFAEDRAWLVNEKALFEKQLAGVTEERNRVLAEVAGFGRRLQAQLSVYRAQRAWRVMLACRKAYTLLLRSKAKFLAWACGVPFGRVGDLSEFELPFPDVDRLIARAGDAATPSKADAAPAIPTLPVSEDASQPPADPAPQRNQYDVIILAIIDFDFRFQRPQQLAAEFARRGHRVFWISPTRFLPHTSTSAYDATRLRDNLWEIHLRSRQPDIYMGEMDADHVASMSGSLDCLFRERGIAGHVVMVQLPFWRRLALKLRDTFASLIVYDSMDDWDTFENMGAFNVAEEKHLAKECDVLVVTGAELERKFRARGLHPVLARNGADFSFFSQAQPNQLLSGVPGPIVGYFGAIADWIDLDLVYQVARSRPQYSFVLIGQVFGRDVSSLQALPNVHLLGNKPYPEIPSYLYHFNVCIIPFLINQVTKATDPVKLYEYFSLGKPVVATEMAELNYCGELLYLARNAEDFAQKVDAAVAENDARLVTQRIEFASANTWSSRVADIDSAIRDSFPLVSVLIVTHNSLEFVQPCLESILRNTSYPSYEVVLIDNASTDGTAARIYEYASGDPRLHVEVLEGNLGFAGGNNLAARAARGQYLLFLNIDTVVTPGWIERLLRHLHRDPSIGLICPVTNFAGNEIKINVSYRNCRGMEEFAKTLANGKSGQSIDIEVAPLYCALMRRAVWEQVGEMDTRYEVGMFEDDDLSIRVRMAGYRVVVAEDCFMHHFGQGSFAKLAPEAYNRIFEANRKRFEAKWARPWVAHRTRPGVRPPTEEERFDPVQFTR